MKLKLQGSRLYPQFGVILLAVVGISPVLSLDLGMFDGWFSSENGLLTQSYHVDRYILKLQGVGPMCC